jgi:hypothetical protein
MLDHQFIGRLHIFGLIYNNTLQRKLTNLKDIDKYARYVTYRKRREIVQQFVSIGIIGVKKGKYGGFWMLPLKDKRFKDILDLDIQNFRDTFKVATQTMDQSLRQEVINIWKSLKINNPWDFSSIIEVDFYNTKKDDSILESIDNDLF